ncbi:hypothetical protein A3A92_01530 [Candidatus Nomurabacteria bacterium RIFCSPLOWO2_01_FULL_37_49]|nr:MAG: hypothetical protein A3A92_01530 [Candidatus Nomurabacteria bacterium RIFCSPLOWO2_01_FULL_37_49]
METQKQPSLNELVQERVQQAVTSIPVRLRRIDRRKGYTLEELEDVFEMRISENLLSYLEEKSKWVKDEQGNYKLVEIYEPLKERQITKTKSERILEQKAKRELKIENEGPGKYLNLNKYESDLLDYLKSNFNESEFTSEEIKFQNARVRNRSKMWEHLQYLTSNDYLEKLRTEEKRNKYYHYLRLKPHSMAQGRLTK